MSEPDTSDALEAEIEQAQFENDPAKADALYQRLIGSTDLARSRERAEPAPLVQAEAEDEGQAEAPGPSPSDIENVGGSRLADYRPYDALSEDERGQEFDRVFSLADSEVSRGILQAEWSGADFDRNLAFGEAALASIPGSLDVLRILEVVGLADHPDLIRWIASAGRLMASKPGEHASEYENCGYRSHRSYFFFRFSNAAIHSRASRCASAIWAGVTPACVLWIRLQGYKFQYFIGAQPARGPREFSPPRFR